LCAIEEPALIDRGDGHPVACHFPTMHLAEMVGKAHIANAIALNSAAFHGARIIGPVIAGIAIAYLGIPACFYLNALSFVAVIIALYRIDTRGDIRGKSEGMLRDFNKGIVFIRGNQEITNVFLLIAVFSVMGLPYISLLPIFAAEVFHAGPKGLGFLVGASGIGALTAALLIAARRDIPNKPRFMSFAALTFAAALFLFSLSNIFWLSLLMIMAAGWGMMSYLALANIYIQITVPDELRGRVMSIYSLVFLGTVPIGNAIMGFAADYLGTPSAVTVSGLLCLIAAALFSKKYMKAGSVREQE